MTLPTTSFFIGPKGEFSLFINLKCSKDYFLSIVISSSESPRCSKFFESACWFVSFLLLSLWLRFTAEVWCQMSLETLDLDFLFFYLFLSVNQCREFLLWSAMTLLRISRGLFILITESIITTSSCTSNSLH